MATTEQGDMITDVFNRVTVGMSMKARVQAKKLAFEMLDPQDIDGTFPAFLQQLFILFQANSADYTKATNNYIKVFTAAEGSPIMTGALLANQVEINREAFVKRMTGAMLHGYKKKATQLGKTTRELPKNNAAFAQSVANMSKDYSGQILTQGRDTIATVASNVYQGFARKTNVGACNFCLMLATRADYASKKSASFQAHRGCNCTPEIVVDTTLYQPDPAAQAGYNKYLEEQAALKEKLGTKEYNARRAKQADKRDTRKGTTSDSDVKIREKDRQIKDAENKLEVERKEGLLDEADYQQKKKRLNDIKEDNLLAKKKRAIRKQRYAGEITQEEEIKRIRKAELRAVERKAEHKPKGNLPTANKADAKAKILGKI